MTNKPMLSVELLPCLFCGSAASLEDHRLVWCVRCTKCSASILGDRAPDPHGDGVSSDEVQDAQAAAMNENTDWAAYEKSAVDAWNALSESSCKAAAQHQGEPVVPIFAKGCTVLESGNGKYRIVTSYQNRIDAWADYEALCRAEQPAPVADHTQCEECKGWGYHENHYEGGGTECGECGGSGNAPVALVMPERYSLAMYQMISGFESVTPEQFDLVWSACRSEVARLNGVKP